MNQSGELAQTPRLSYYLDRPLRCSRHVALFRLSPISHLSLAHRCHMRIPVAGQGDRVTALVFGAFAVNIRAELGPGDPGSDTGERNNCHGNHDRSGHYDAMHGRFLPAAAVGDKRVANFACTGRTASREGLCWTLSHFLNGNSC